MTLRERRIIYLAFTAVFLMVAPILVLYAIGYRFDLKSKTLIETGTFLVRSAPKNVNIFIDNTLVKKRTPAVFTDLKPGDHLITLQNPSYHNWSKTIQISPKLTTFAEHVVLFRNQPEVTALYANTTPLRALTVSQTGRLAAAATVLPNQTSQVVLIPLNDKPTVLPLWSLTKKDELKALYWAPSGRKLLIETKRAVQAINVERPQEIVEIKKFFHQPIHELRWHPHDDSFVYVRSELNLWKINLATKRAELITTLILPKFITEANNIYTPTPTVTLAKKYPLLTASQSLLPDEWTLIRLDSRNIGAEPMIERSLPGFKTNQEVSFSPDYIGLYRPAEKILTFWPRSSLTSSQEKQTFSWQNVEKYEWAPDFTRLIIFASNAIWIWDQEKRELGLQKIRALTQLPQKHFWFPDFYHSLLFYPRELKIAELDTQTKPLQTTILTLNTDLTPYGLSLNGKFLYLSLINNDGLFEFRSYRIH